MTETIDNNAQYIMIALVSDQTIPNIVPLFRSDAPKFSKMFLLYTGERYKGQLESIKETIKLRFPYMIFEPRLLSNAGSQTTFAAVEQIFNEIYLDKQQITQKIVAVCNWTGGTKPMSKGMLDAVQKYDQTYDCRAIYVDTESRKIIDPKGVYFDPALTVQLTVKEYLYAHDVQQEPSNMQSQTIVDWVKAADFLWTALYNSYQEQYGYAHPIEIQVPENIVERRNNTKWFIRHYINNAEHLAEQLKTLGVVSQIIQSSDTQLVELIPTNGDAKQFLKGGWLEYYVYRELAKKYCQNEPTGIDGKLIQSLKLEWKNTKMARSAKKLMVHNELDVVLVEGVRMAALSCKVGGPFRKNSSKEDNSEEDKIETNEPIYELEAIVRSFGLYSSKILVVAQPRSQLKENLQLRADVFSINVFTFEDLPDIANKIDAIINR